jgi:ribosomal-protein-alanine N-acetyltransferase
MRDVEPLWPYVSDPEFPKFMAWSAHRNRKETEDWVASVLAARAEGTDYVWSIRQNDTLCAMIGLHDVVRTSRAWQQDRSELGYWCGPPYQNRGIITEAAREVLRFGFEDLALHKITVGCATENGASRRVIEKLGFRLVGEQRDHFYTFGCWWNHLSFEMVVDEWRALTEMLQTGA